MRRVVHALIVVVAGVNVPNARADDAQPWAVGVTAEQKARAQTFLDAGNALLFARDYGAALDKYRQAVAIWDHPAARFNIVVCLIQLDRSAEAWDNLVLAMAHGAAPFEESVYREVLAHRRLLAEKIAIVEATCSQPGVRLTLDGQTLLDCPGTRTRAVMPGTHQMTGDKDGFMTKTIEISVRGGEQRRVDVSLISLDSASTTTQRWPTWMPWIVLGSGVLVASVGGAIQLKSLADMREYDDAVAINCTTSCMTDSTRVDRDLYDRARLENKVAIGVTAVGLTTAAIGGVLLYLNRGKTTYRSSSEKLAAVPTANGIAVSGRW